MEEKLATTFEGIEEELRAYPAPVLEEFKKARESLLQALTADQSLKWAQVGVGLAGQTVRSWEAAAQYYSVSPEVVGYIPFGYLVRWAECGSTLCHDSPSLATSYFQASPAVLKKLRSRNIEGWANLGRSLYKGTWKSSTLSCKFFEATPGLLESLTFQELGRFVAFLDALSHRSYDLSAECLTLGQRLLPLVGEDKDAFISLASALAESGWRQVKSFFDAGARALPRIQAGQRLRFLTLFERLVRSGGANIPGMMLEVSQALARIDAQDHSRVLTMSEGLMSDWPLAVPEFLKSSPVVLERISMSQLEKWYEGGVKVLGQNPEGGLAYFKVESAFSESVIEALSSGVEFARVKDVVEVYCRALAGAQVKLASSEDLAEKHIGWVSGESPSTEGSTVYVPVSVDRYPSKAENFSWYKVVSTHQVAHMEFGSFRFEFESPSTVFKDLRLAVERRRQRTADGAISIHPKQGAVPDRTWVTDVQRFFNLFDDRRLALDVFTVVEDGRLDARVKMEYPGIKSAYVTVQQASVDGRPDIKTLPARQAMVELLVRLSLTQNGGLPAPSRYIREARRVARLARRAMSAQTTVEDVAEASLRIYAVLSQIPNEDLPEDEWQELDLEGADADSPEESEDREGILENLAAQQGAETGPEGEQEYDSVQEVEFRGNFKPELVQLLAALRMRQGRGDRSAGEQISQEMLEEMLRNSAELEVMEGESSSSASQMASNILKEAGLNAPPSGEYRHGPLIHVDEDGGSLEATEPQTFVYDEWDFRAEDYKPRWCIVRQKGMAEGDAAFYGNTLHAYGSLVAQIRRQFELMVPEMFRKVRKLEDGEDVDIDDVIETMVDIRTGAGPSDKLYWRRNKVQRNVAVVFLLDTSASTAEAIDESRRVSDDWDAPHDPAEYMMWLRTRRGEGARRSYKRIIDVEKEAVVLLIHALESIGDVYGIYGFSGYGRENVEFYTIKDVDEPFSERAKARIDRIAPLHATRMGPAIRHATYKLKKQDARTKLLFLISDGRPQDRGYSREGVEKEYAVHDTRMAFEEAKKDDVQTFCLTVDKNGHDYLGTMCQDIGYEVLDDVHALPQRLLFLYKRLTM